MSVEGVPTGGEYPLAVVITYVATKDVLMPCSAKATIPGTPVDAGGWDVTVETRRWVERPLGIAYMATVIVAAMTMAVG